MPGVADIRAQHPEFTDAQFQEIANAVRAEMLEDNAKSMISVQYCEPHLIWSMDIFERLYKGIKVNVLQVIDLGSRIKLEPAIKAGAFSGEEVAAHLNMLFHLHETPLFLKRDNGSNLNSREVFEVMKLFCAIPFNSPPGCPQFNGVMERSQGEIKRYLNVMLNEAEALDVFAATVYSAIDRANHRKRRVLNGKTAMQCWEEESLHFTKREREAIYNEIKIIAARILEKFSKQKKERKDATACAWRHAVRTYLEEKGYIKLFRDGKTLRDATA